MSCSGIVERLQKMYPCCKPCDPKKVERYRLYWSGKSPRVRKAVEGFLIDETLTWKEGALKYGVSEVALRNHVRILRYLERKGQIALCEVRKKGGVRKNGKL